MNTIIHNNGQFSKEALEISARYMPAFDKLRLLLLEKDNLRRKTAKKP